ncbi:MAG: hypothetical protein NWE88_04505 [Candidatus Bathyarchaeota archaeon]|nr:hypothetical protein [Candidatus Bathyarchaeota archaeon]
MIVSQTKNNIPLLGHKMVPFKVIKEPIYKYKFADGGILHSKYTLIMVHFEKNLDEMLEEQKENTSSLGTGINMKHHITMGIDCPDEMKGVPNRIKGENLRERVIEEDVDIIEPHEPFFEYKLANGFRLKGKIVLMNVDKTDRFDKMGIPVYLIDNTVEMKITIPKKLQKKIPKKKT